MNMNGVIHGTALLASSMMLGRCLGALLAQVLGIDADMGGVGFAMVILMLAMTVMRRSALVTPAFETGIGYWAAVYIPIVVAMAATQNVVGAVRGGPVAIAAGGLAVAAGFAAVPLLSGRPTPRGIQGDD